MNYSNLARDEVKLLSCLIGSMQRMGYDLRRTYDGEGWNKTATVEQALNMINAVEESIISFQKIDSDETGNKTKRVYFYILLGNGEIDELIYDHTDTPEACGALAHALRFYSFL